MDIESLRLILTLAQTLNFTQASALAFMTQPTFSRRISQTENALGVRIFSRNTHGVSLTEEGEAILPEIRRLVERYDALIARCHDAGSGMNETLRIGYSVYPYGLGLCMKVEKRLQDKGEKFSVDVVSVPFEDALESLADGVIDGLVSIDCLPLPDAVGRVRIEASKAYAVINIHDPLSLRTQVSVSDLCGRKVIITGLQNYPALYQMRHDYLVSNGIQPSDIIGAGSAKEAMMMASREEGIPILNEEGHINTIDTLRPVPFVSDMPSIDFIFSWNRCRRSVALDRYIEAVKEVSSSLQEGVKES